MKTQLILIALSVCCVYAWPFDFEGPKVYERTEMGNKVDKVSTKMLQTAFKSAGDNKNLVMSPAAVLVLLNLYAQADAGGVRDEIQKFSGDGALDKDTFSSYQRLAHDFANPNTPALNFKSKVYLSKDYTLTDQFKTNAKNMDAQVENINFHDSKKAEDTINDWADKETKGHIKNAVSGKLDPETVTAMFNVIFFEGHWHVPFNANETKDKDFHVDQKTTVKKPMMTLEMPLFYAENKDINARFLELPYKESGFRMIVVLPDEVDGLPKVLDKLSNTGMLNDVFALAPAFSNIKLELPRFNVKAELDLNGLLPKLGVKKMFSEAVHNIVKERAVVVDKMFQKAFIKVDEEGATAGAFTGIIAVPTSSNYSPPPPIPFKADRPFAYAILYQDVVLFIGTYTQ